MPLTYCTTSVSDEVRWVIDQALAHEDPQIRQEGREMEEYLSASSEAGGE